MPTAAKLIAAIGLAAVAWLASTIVMERFPPGTDFGLFAWINLVLGLLCGWRVIGSRAGQGGAAAIASGFTGTVALVFWALAIQSAWEMVQRALDNRYDGPVEALTATFGIAVDFGAHLRDPAVLTCLLVGGIATGLLAELAARRWR